MASDEDMQRLRDALRTTTEWVEISRHLGSGSSDARTASENAHRASQANERGERVARVIDAEGRAYECGVDRDQIVELERLGAKVLG